MHGPAGDRRQKTLDVAPADAGSTRREPGLVDRALRGDAAAFESLVRGHYDRVWRLVHRIVRREREAEEVVQEVFLGARAKLSAGMGPFPGHQGSPGRGKG